ncbi:serine hydrolase domain-containing protein [Hephaestia sp. GCM10023244]|uniref:serine hydrolase domain-containing protein n=1 Tax=unclassified Hephaestia TaxID=2631281 RepID=UPI002077870B|nr:serine hydrolase domain-containing protein [Hephaestia sp. MAHUQ-44]MCM8732495.1 beta-lactamase family protein [Hephaestia sp. MAHUQ-44]
MRVLAVTAVLVAMMPIAAQAASDPFDCTRAAAYSAKRDGVSYLVLRDGKVICEDYTNGGKADSANLLASGTKSFSGIIAAAAAQDGFLSLDEPVSATIVEWQNDPRRRSITIRQLLGLVSGIASGKDARTPSYTEAIEAIPVVAPGESFQYGAVPFQIFGELVKRKLAARGEPADPLAYLTRRVLAPIGIAPVQWRRAPDGNPMMAAGAALTARQWATFGEFVRLGGVWDGQQLVDPRTLAELFHGSSVNPAYGISWWLAASVAPADRPRQLRAAIDLSAHADELPKGIVLAAGAGRQRLYIVPDERIVIVRQAARATIGPQRRQRAVRAQNQPDAVDSRWSDTQFLKQALNLAN